MKPVHKTLKYLPDGIDSPDCYVEPAYLPALDLADEADWENCMAFVSLEEVGLEEKASHADGDSSVPNYRSWFYDHENESGTSDDF